MASRRYAVKTRLRSSRRTYRKKSAYPTRRTTRKRTYRKKTSMKKRIINTMAKKKRDTMVNAYASGANPDPATVASNFGTGIIITAAPSGLKGNNTHMFIFNPMRRTLVPSNAYYSAARTSSDVFAVGFSEKFEIIPSDSSCWLWRRIVVSQKELWGTSAVQAQTGAQAPSGNTNRQLIDIGMTSSTQAFQDVYDEVLDKLFAGVAVTDWNNTMTARIDTRRFTVHTDKTRRLTSGNAASSPRTIRTYTKFNRMMYFDDEENGTTISPSYNLVTDKRGMGTITVFDLFQCPAPIAPTSQITVGVNSTMYWHEK
uniref:Capsid protein n=1 Tax=Turdus hortulorum Genomoviridae sp. TaxID=2814995 RepID=A0A8A4XD26_9VIRU|nr:MAG: capsid protein [Gemycircularvirus]